MENPRTLIDLPFEVLDLIFKELRCLREKVRLAQTHEKLGKAFAFHSRNKYRIFEPSNWLTDESWAFLIQECGTSIEELIFSYECSSWNDSIAKSVVVHCPNVKSLSAYLFTRNRDSIQLFLEKMKNSLISLTLNQRDDFPLEFLRVVGEMTQLKQLSITVYFDENVYHLEKIIALEKLTIKIRNNSSRVRVDLLRITLYVYNVEIIPYKKPFVATWARLETLNLGRCKLPIELPDCPELKHLNIYIPICYEDYGYKFILKNGRNLETLYEEFEPPINADSFLELLRGCPKLRSFYTKMEFIKLYSGYVSTILEILKDNGVTQENPSELVICRRIKWKWFRGLLLRAPNAGLIDLYEGTD